MRVPTHSLMEAIASPLVAVFIALEAIDLLLYLQAPHFEANPVLWMLPAPAVAVAKVAIVSLFILGVRRLWPTGAQFALACGIAIAAFGVGTNVATLSMMAAISAQFGGS